MPFSFAWFTKISLQTHLTCTVKWIRIQDINGMMAFFVKKKKIYKKFGNEIELMIFQICKVLEFFFFNNFFILVTMFLWFTFTKSSRIVFHTVLQGPAITWWLWSFGMACIQHEDEINFPCVYLLQKNKMALRLVIKTWSKYNLILYLSRCVWSGVMVPIHVVEPVQIKH